MAAAAWATRQAWIASTEVFRSYRLLAVAHCQRRGLTAESS
jgi:hypothetical protein